MKRLLLTNIFFAFIASALAVEPLMTLEDAIRIALDSSYGIKISSNELRVAENNVSKGNAGYWPSVDWNAGGNFNWNNFSNQKLSTGNDFQLTNQTTRQVNTNIALNWTIFDGMRMFATYEKLLEIYHLNELELKSVIEKRIYEVSLSYYNIVSLELQLKAIEQNLQISEERLKLEKARLEVGKANALAAKQAQIDLNAMLAQKEQQLNELQKEKVYFNQLLSRYPQTAFDVLDTIPLKGVGSLEELKNLALSNNTELKILEKNQKISELTLKELKSEKYPSLTLNTAYGYNQTNNSGGFTQSTNSLGLSTGLTMKWNLFDGGRVRRNISNMQILMENDQLAIDELQLNVHAALQQALYQYEYAVKVAAIEEENYNLSLESLTIVQERFRLGVANTLELKDAQNVYDQSSNRRVLALYNAKVAEINLNYLTGLMNQP